MSKDVKIQVAFTKDFSEKERKEFLEELKKLGFETSEYTLVLKSIDAPTVIWITILLLNPVTKGFGEELGRDLYNYLKNLIIKTFKKKEKSLN